MHVVIKFLQIIVYCIQICVKTKSTHFTKNTHESKNTHQVNIINIY
jgi:hypothetical protein